MKIILLITLLLTLIFGGVRLAEQIYTGAPPYQIADDAPSDTSDEYAWLNNWERPDVPAKVALQVGHYKNDEVPDELHRLKGNTGASGGGKSEWEVNLAIAKETASILSEKGITVEIIPATVPPRYWADVFVAIHADGNLDPGKSGYKAAAPYRDITGKAEALRVSVEENYERSTGLEKDPTVTRNMRGYYAFGWWRYEHSVHPMTTSIILETGFLTSPTDRSIIVDKPNLSADGLADGVIEFLENEKLI